MSSAVLNFTDNIFLHLCQLASPTKNNSAINPRNSSGDFQNARLELFLVWLSLSRREQVDDMLPYLRTMAGANSKRLQFSAAETYFETLIPPDAPPEAKELFKNIVQGVFLIFLSSRP